MATTAQIGDVTVTAIVDITPPSFPIENVFSVLDFSKMGRIR